MNGMEVNSRGVFLFCQAALPLLLKGVDAGSKHPPTLIFTGATASVRGSANFSSLAAGKWANRALAQSLAREFMPKGIHVAHAIIDGVIDLPKATEWLKDAGPDAKINPDAVRLLPKVKVKLLIRSDCGRILESPHAAEVCFHIRNRHSAMGREVVKVPYSATVNREMRCRGYSLDLSLPYSTRFAVGYINME